MLNWVVASGKNLTAIYVTHAHGDHFFGLAPLLERFPHARAVATPEVVKAMHEQLSPASVDNFWRRLFPGQIPDRLLVAEPLEDRELEAGRTQACRGECRANRHGSFNLPSRPVDRADRWLAMPSIMEFIPILARPTGRAGLKWISTLDKLEALNPLAVIAGHKIPENPDDPRIIGETRQYLRDFIALEATTTARQLYDAMLDLYPDRVNPGSLWGAANTAKRQALGGRLRATRSEDHAIDQSPSRPCIASGSGLHEPRTPSPPRSSFANPGMPDPHVVLLGAPACAGAEELGVVVEIEMVRLHEPRQMHGIDAGGETAIGLVDVVADRLGAGNALIAHLEHAVTELRIFHHVRCRPVRRR